MYNLNNICNLSKRKEALMSKIRRAYVIKLILRIIVLIATVILYFVAPDQFGVIEGWNFFKGFSVFHLLWLAWVIDMIVQLIPVKNNN